MLRLNPTLPALGGQFTRCAIGGRDVGSLYQLSRAQLARGVPSHWTPYIAVGDVDAVGALVGLWQAIGTEPPEAHAG